MGKKRIIEKPEEDILKEKEKMEAVLKKTQVTQERGKKLDKALAHIQSSFNNTVITLTNLQGDVLAWASAGSLGFKGAKKSTPFAASKVAEALAEKVKKFGVGEVSILVRGIGSGRDSAIRSLASHGLNITSIRDITPLPHNGCRARKARRV